MKIAKVLDLPGFEPGAFRMQSERDTTTLQTRVICLSQLLSLKAAQLGMVAEVMEVWLSHSSGWGNKVNGACLLRVYQRECGKTDGESSYI